MNRARIVVARGPIEWVMRKIGLAGLAMPWRTVYLLTEFSAKADLIAHEMVHIEQMEREGRVRFCILYLWWLYRRGYWDNPFEIEAYERAPVDWLGVE